MQKEQEFRQFISDSQELIKQKDDFIDECLGRLCEQNPQYFKDLTGFRVLNLMRENLDRQEILCTDIFFDGLDGEDTLDDIMFSSYFDEHESDFTPDDFVEAVEEIQAAIVKELDYQKQRLERKQNQKKKKEKFLQTTDQAKFQQAIDLLREAVAPSQLGSLTIHFDFEQKQHKIFEDWAHGLFEDLYFDEKVGEFKERDAQLVPRT